jgi:hypothetical protein
MIGRPRVVPRGTQSGELLTVQEAAWCLRATRRTLDRWRASGIGPRSIRLPLGGRQSRREDLDAYVAGHQEEGCTR